MTKGEYIYNNDGMAQYYQYTDDDGKLQKIDLKPMAPGSMLSSGADSQNAWAQVHDLEAKFQAQDQQRVDAYDKARQQEIALAGQSPGRQGTILTGFQKTPGFNPTSIL